MDASVLEDDRIEFGIEVPRGDRGKLAPHPRGGNLRGPRDGWSEAAGIIAGCDRPRILCGIEIGHHADVAGRQSESVGDDLREHGAMSLTLSRRRYMNVD